MHSHTYTRQQKRTSKQQVQTQLNWKCETVDRRQWPAGKAISPHVFMKVMDGGGSLSLSHNLHLTLLFCAWQNEMVWGCVSDSLRENRPFMCHLQKQSLCLISMHSVSACMRTVCSLQDVKGFLWDYFNEGIRWGCGITGIFKNCKKPNRWLFCKMSFSSLSLQ